MFWTDQKARTEQIPNDDEVWSTFLYLAGRGAGKTRTAAEWIAWQAARQPGTRWAVVAATFGDVRDTCAEGESGLITILRRYEQLKNYNRSMGEIRLHNGSLIKLFSADEPDRLRGPQFHGAWCDELAAWRYPETWDQLQFGLRLGNDPRVIVSTTPRPTKLIKQLIKQGQEDGSVVITRGSTYSNAANLAPQFLAKLRAQYEGTRLARQELHAEILDDVEGALFTGEMLEATRVTEAPVDFVKIVVAIDPAVTNGPESDETGIVIVAKGTDGRGYVIADRSCRDTPLGWAQRAIAAYQEYGADRIVAEKNQGGDFIETTLRQILPTVSYKGITAKRGKVLRAEPVAALYEQGRVSHVGLHEELERQMTEWLPDSGTSPDRLDALVHGIAELGFAWGGAADRFFAQLAPTCDQCGRANSTDAAQCVHCSNVLREAAPTPTRPGLPKLQ